MRPEEVDSIYSAIAVLLTELERAEERPVLEISPEAEGIIGKSGRVIRDPENGKWVAQPGGTERL